MPFPPCKFRSQLSQARRLPPFLFQSNPFLHLHHSLLDRFVCDVLRLANYLMVDDLVMADCNALMGGAGEVRSGILGRNPKFIMTYLKVSSNSANPPY